MSTPNSIPNPSSSSQGPPTAKPRGIQHAKTPEQQALLTEIHTRLEANFRLYQGPLSAKIPANIGLLRHLCEHLDTDKVFIEPLYHRALYDYTVQTLNLLVQVLKKHLRNFDKLKMVAFESVAENPKPEDTSDVKAMRRWLLVELLNVAVHDPPLPGLKNLNAAEEAFRVICSSAEGESVAVTIGKEEVRLAAVPADDIGWQKEQAKCAVAALWAVSLYMTHRFAGAAVELLGKQFVCNCLDCQKGKQVWEKIHGKQKLEL